MAVLTGMLKLAEPVLFTHMLCTYLLGPVEEQLIYKKECLQLYNTSICKEILIKSNVHLKAFEDIVQQRTARWLFYRSIIETVPSMLSCLVLGSISDRIGRKWVMFCPAMGNIFRTVGLVFNAYFIDQSVAYLFIGRFISGMFGNDAFMIAAVNVYVADETSLTERTVRVSILESLLYISAGIASFLSGVLIVYLGYLNTSILTASIQLFPILYIAFLLKDSYSPNVERGRSCSKERLCFPAVVMSRPRPNYGRLTIILLSIVFMVETGVYQSSARIVILYLRHYPLHWLPTEVGYYLGSGLLARGFGVIIIVPLLVKVFHLSDLSLIIIGLLSVMTSSIITGFAKSNWVMYLGSVIVIFQISFSIAASLAMIGGGFSAPSIRARMTKIGHKSERATILAVISCSEVISGFLSQAGSDNLYYATVSWFPGFCFFMMAAVLLVPFCLIWYLQQKTSNVIESIPVNVSPDQEDE